MMVGVKDFLVRVEEIANEEPAYEHGGDGSHGTCDCIGLIIGGIRRAGGQWRGTHGSNYAARFEVEGQVKRLAGTGELKPGMLVFKAYEPGQGGYNLPGKYEKGGEGYTGDLKDYYHVGVVLSVFPLKIRHMTKPRAKVDTSLGKWSYYGWCKKIAEEGGKPLDKVTISGGNQEAPINMRAAGSTGAALVAKIPQGSEAELIEGGGYWSLIRWEGRQGYVMTEFVHREKSEGDLIQVDRAELEKAYDILGGLLGLRG